MTIRFGAAADSVYRDVDTRVRANSGGVLEFLSRGFEITRFHTADAAEARWLATAKADGDTGRKFGLRGEYLIVGDGPTAEFQPRTLLSELPGAEDEIDQRVRFLVSSDPFAEAGSSAWAASAKCTVVVLRGSTGQGLDEAEAIEELHRLLATFLWRMDRFDEPAPVRLDEEFFGREQLIQEAAAKLHSGQPVAVLGLRKIGKTSVLGRLEQTMLEGTSSLTAVSAQCGSSARLRNGRWWTLAQDAVDSWGQSLTHTAREAGSKIQAPASQLHEATAKKVVDASRLRGVFEKDVAALVKCTHALRTALGRETGRLLLVVDDCECLYPHISDASHWRADFFVFWNAIQGIRSGLGNPRDLVFVLGASDPSGVEQGSLVDQPNPLFQTHSVYVGPMSVSGAASLLTGLGGRSGLAFDDAAIRRVHEFVGGHPLLLRRFGSALHRSLSPRFAVTNISEAIVTQEFKKTKREFFNQVLWILDHLRRVAPEEERLLRDLALGGAGAYEACSSDLREAFAFKLERFGLVRFVGQVPEVQLELIKEAIRKPTANEFTEQKQRLKALVDTIESALRARLCADLSKDTGTTEAVHGIASLIPSDAKNRPLGRQELIDLGESGGLPAVLEALNWGDYEILFNRAYEVVSWSGPEVKKEERLALLKKTFLQAHLVRHNNDHELRELIRADGFAALFGRFCSVLDMVAGARA